MGTSLLRQRETLLDKSPDYAFECRILDRDAYHNYLRLKSNRPIYSGQVKYHTLTDGWDFVVRTESGLMVGLATKETVVCCVWVGSKDRAEVILDRCRSWVECSLEGLDGPEMLPFQWVPLKRSR